MLERHGIAKLNELDNLDDRRECFYLLSLLSISERQKFLEHAIRAINQGVVFTHQPPHVLLTVTAEVTSVQEAYMDLMFAVAKYDLPVQAVLDDLVQYATKIGKMTTYERHQALAVELPKLLD